MTRRQILFVASLLSLVFLLGLGVQWWRLSRVPTPSNPISSDTESWNATVASNNYFVEAVTSLPETLNPLFAVDPASLSVIRKIYLPLVGRIPTTGAPNTSGLAERWQFEEEGRSLTLVLYENLRWSDGEPLTSQDIEATYNAIRAPETQSPYQNNFANVEAIEVIDARTVRFQLTTSDCTILQTLEQPILPAHQRQEAVAQSLTTTSDWLPTVGSGPFVAVAQDVGQIELRANPTYWRGAPRLTGWTVRLVEDPATAWTDLVAGQVDLMALTSEQTALAATTPTVTRYSTLHNAITFLALNLADPTDPQPGRDGEGGTRIAQGTHPILGDLAVRQALARGIDREALLNALYGTNGTVLNSYLLPTVSWAYEDDLSPYSYSLTEATTLLDESGWRDENGDGVRERDGQTLQLTLLTNRDSNGRVTAAQLLQKDLQLLGIELSLELLPFDEMTQAVLSQRFDMVLIGWDNLSADPANSNFWHSRQDLPGSGINFVSYQNEAVDTWLDEARQAPACDGGYRALRYRKIQKQIHADLPYIILGGQQQHWAYRAEWQGLDPQPWGVAYNVHLWQKN